MELDPENTPTYSGNSVPRIIRLAWTVFVLFSVYYLVRYGWPDFLQWTS